MSKKPKLYKAKRDPELFYYFTAKKEKRWMYRHRYYDALGKRREKSKQGFTSEKEAYRELLKVKSSILNGDIKEVQDSDITVSEWLDIWYETKKVSWKESTQKERKRIIEKIMKPLLGRYKLSKLDLMTYEREYINKLLEQYSPSSAKKYHDIFQTAVNAAVANKTIKENNFTSIKITDDRKKEENFLTREELNVLLNNAKRKMTIFNYTILLTLANTGMRKGEAYGLQWRDIDFDKKIIKIERTRDDYGVRSPKTVNSYREIPVDDELINQLKVYRTWCIETKFRYGLHLAEDDFVFISDRGGTPVNIHTFNFALDRIIRKVGIKRITPHGLRHTHATILLNNKVSVITVAKRLGNTPEEIHKTYGHTDDEADRAAVNIFISAINC